MSYVTAPSSAPTILLVNKSSTSITVNWRAIPDADGYVVYVDDAVYDIFENDTTVTNLIPVTNYSITVRAYQDILGPVSTPLNVTTDDGKYM